MKNGWESVGAAAAAIVLLTVLAYMPAMHAGFFWDDERFITENRVVKASDGLYRIWFTTESDDYYPVTCSVWWLEWRLWHMKATGYHVVNVLLHAVNAVLVWLVLRRLKIPGAWLAALVFAVHPVNVATAAWISEQKNTLSMLFYALAIWFYLKFDESDIGVGPRPDSESGPLDAEHRVPTDEHSDGRAAARPYRAATWMYVLSFLAFLCALLSKTAVVMLPVVLLGCMWWRHGRAQRRDWLCSAPFFVLSLIAAIVNIWFEYNRSMQGQVIRTEGFASRLVTAGWVPWFYLSKALLPIHLIIIYPNWKVDVSRWISWLPGLALVGCFALFWWKRATWGRPLLFGLGYFVVTLFPVLGFFDQGFYRFSLVSDHWQYYSIVGVIALVIAAGDRMIGRPGGESRPVGVLIGGIVLALLTQATWSRAGAYIDPQMLWRETVTKNPNAYVAHYNLGVDLDRRGRLREAIEEYERALQIKPDYPQAHDNLGIVLWKLDRAPEAIGHYEQALKIEPNYTRAHYNLGLALMKLGRVTEAMDHWTQAVRIAPDFTEAHYNLAMALLILGKPHEAVPHFEQVVKLRPDAAEPHYQLGLALERTGRIREATEHYDRALQIRPDYPEAQNNLAWLLATLPVGGGGDPDRAFALSRRACQLTGNRLAPYLDTLAAAYASAGQFEEAVATAQKAIDLATAAGQPQVAVEIATRVDLYRSEQAYRQPLHGTGDGH